MASQESGSAYDSEPTRTDYHDRCGQVTLRLLAVLFFLSGCAALTYEVVWFQLLRLTVGASSISLAMILAAFMGGLGLGALIAPRLVARWRALRVYIVLELGIAFCGLAMPWVVPWMSQLYAAVGGQGDGFDLTARSVICAIALLPPTVLMGATLPVVAHWLGSNRRAMAATSWLYAINTFGAFAGTMLAGLVWLRYFSTWTVSFIAVGLNLAVALMAWWIARRDDLATASAKPLHEAEPDLSVVTETHESDATLRRRALLVIGLSGLTALGAQVLWTRSLGLLLAVTVYTFAIILACFLAGLALGSSGGAATVRRTRRPGVWLGVTQVVLVLAIAWGFWAIDHLVSDMRYLGQWRAKGIGWRMFSDFVRVAVAIFPATLLWGASFPFALALGGRATGTGDRWVARVYVANTIGAIIGALFFTFVGLGYWGSDRSAHLLVGVAGVGAFAILFAAARREMPPPRATGSWRLWRLKMSITDLGPASLRSWLAFFDSTHLAARRKSARVFLLLGVVLLATLGPGVPQDLLMYGHHRKALTNVSWTTLGFREGLVAPTGVVEMANDYRMLYVSGKVVASNIAPDMRLQRMLGHVAALSHGEPESVLIVGMGTGTTAGSFVRWPGIKRIVICEIEPAVLEMAGEHFAAENHNVLNDPRVEIVVDDARHFLATTQEKFDIITSDPIHPWVKGASALYSREYYGYVKRHLNPGGVVTQWVPFYETSDAAAKSMLATFFEAFPEGSVWHAGEFGVGQDVVMLGHPDRERLDLDIWLRNLDRYPDVEADLLATDIKDRISLLSRFMGSASDLDGWLSGSVINRDGALRLEYLAGLGVFTSMQTAILEQIESRRRWPNRSVILNEATQAQVTALIEGRKREKD